MRRYEGLTDEELEATVNALDAQRLAIRDQMLEIQAEMTLRGRIKQLERLNLPDAVKAQVIAAVSIPSAEATGIPGASA